MRTFSLTQFLLWLHFASPAFAFFLQPVAFRSSCLPRIQTTCLYKKSQKGKSKHDKWQPYFERLAKYKEEHVSFDSIEDEELEGWLDDQREQYKGMLSGKKVKLTKKRATALENIGALPNL